MLLIVLFFTFKLTFWRFFTIKILIAIFFQIVFEGIVKNSLGNIAIDDISVAPGVCPSKCFVNIVICKFTLGRKILKTSRPKN